MKDPKDMSAVELAAETLRHIDNPFMREMVKRYLETAKLRAATPDDKAEISEIIYKIETNQFS